MFTIILSGNNTIISKIFKSTRIFLQLCGYNYNSPREDLKYLEALSPFVSKYAKEEMRYLSSPYIRDLLQDVAGLFVYLLGNFIEKIVILCYNIVDSGNFRFKGNSILLCT